jgi:hypothetical protein
LSPIFFGERIEPASWLRPALAYLVEQMDLAPTLVEEMGPDWGEMFYWIRRLQKISLSYALRTDQFDWALELLNQMHGRVLVQEALDAVEEALEEPALAAFSESRTQLRAIRQELIHALGQLTPTLVDNPTEGRRATIEALNTNVDALRVKERSAIDAMATARAAAARVPGFEALDPAFAAVTLEQLQTAVPADGVTVLLIDVPEMIKSSTELEERINMCLALVIQQDKVEALELPDLPACIESMASYVASSNTDAHTRRAAAERDASGVVPDPAGFQNTLDALVDAFWSPLQAAIPSVRNVCLITHGQSHILPFSVGQPEGVRLTRYPGLTMYGQQQGLIQSPAQPVIDESPLPMGLMVNAEGLPWVRWEAMFVRSLWDNAEDVDGWHGRAMARGHIACHGVARGAVHDDDHKEGVLLVGREQVLGVQETVLSPHPLPPELLVMSCLVGQVSDDRLGTPTGLVVSMMRRGARVVVGALTPINDVAAGWLSVLIHESWHAGRPLAQAVDEAKAALSTQQGELWDRAEVRLRTVVAEYLALINKYLPTGEPPLDLEAELTKHLQRPTAEHVNVIQHALVVFGE